MLLRIRYADAMLPSALKRTAEAPPVAEISEFDTYTQPLPAAKQAPPSGASCQVYDVVPTRWRDRAITRLVNPSGSWIPLPSAARSGPYGLVPGWAGSANAADQRLPVTAAAPAPITVVRNRVRRSIPTSID